MADRFIDAFENATLELATQPRIGGYWDPEHPDLSEHRVWPIREFPNYLIIYRPLDPGIEVVRIVHGAQDLTSILN